MKFVRLITKNSALASVPKHIDHFSKFSPSPLSMKQFLDFGESCVFLLLFCLYTFRMNRKCAWSDLCALLFTGKCLSRRDLQQNKEHKYGLLGCTIAMLLFLWVIWRWDLMILYEHRLSEVTAAGIASCWWAGWSDISSRSPLPYWYCRNAPQ